MASAAPQRAESPARVILHVDMDAYFASIAQLDHPELRGVPVIVGGSRERGVVASASYEARAFGVRSAMPMYQALKRCPQAVVVRGDMARYREMTRQLRGIWGRYSPTVEVASLDEAYLDLTGCERLLGPPDETAYRLQRETKAETGLTCSVGVGSSKLIAKLASEHAKPRGVHVVPPGTERVWLAPKAVSAIPGIGPKTAERLQQLGILRVEQIFELPESLLERYLGGFARTLLLAAEGQDPRQVVSERTAKSIGHERTLFRNLSDGAELEAILHDLVLESAFRLRSKGLLARTVTLKLRYGDFSTFTRAQTLAAASDDDSILAKAAIELLRRHREPGRPVRLVGVSLSQLTPHAQLNWLDDGEGDDRRQLHQTLDDLRRKYGLRAVSRGAALPARRPRD